MIINALIITVFSLLLLNSFYLFVFALAGSVKPKNKQLMHDQTGVNRFLILIPAYKEDEVIIKSVESVMAQNYKSSLFHCAVIADQLKADTIKNIRLLGAEAFELPQLKNRNKANAIQYYLNNCTTQFDSCIVLDADNLVEENLLNQANVYLNNGIKVIQGRRVAKKENNSLSRLDSISEIINNHIFRKGQRGLGLSASLIGSGMILDMKFFESVMKDMNVISGFDKEMELRILKLKNTIEYAEEIIIYDEKVSNGEVYVNQRRRWTYAQLYFLRKNAKNAIIQLFAHANFDYFNKVLQFALLPRIITLGLSILFVPVAYLAGSNIFLAAWVILLLIITSFLLALKGAVKLDELFRLSAKIPFVFYGMLKAIFTSHKASKTFIHTPHSI
jgi:cellulose synthase/poly-beta-1,6-N-acetylglucosamine synthase-like glycosyltransferase